MNFNVTSATQNLMNTFEARGNGKSCFARPARETASTRYFPCLACLPGAVEATPPLGAVPATAAPAQPQRAPDAVDVIVAISDFGFQVLSKMPTTLVLDCDRGRDRRYIF